MASTEIHETDQKQKINSIEKKLSTGTFAFF